MKIIVILTLMAELLLATGCSKPHDLDAPCTDFGRYCAQVPLNPGAP